MYLAVCDDREEDLKTITALLERWQSERGETLRWRSFRSAMELLDCAEKEPFSLYFKVSLYAAICISLPFLLFQIWGFVAPGATRNTTLFSSVIRCQEASRASSGRPARIA